MEREAAMALLLNLREYRSALIGLERSIVEPNGLLRLQFRLPWGFLARIYLAREWGEDQEQILFRSHGGNVEMFGSLDLVSIRRGLTEVLFVMEYRIIPPIHRWIDRSRLAVDALVDAQISNIETHFMRPVRGIQADRNLPSPMNGHHKEEGDDPPA